MKLNNKSKVTIFSLLVVTIILAFASGWHKAKADNLQKKIKILEKQNKQLRVDCLAE